MTSATFAVPAPALGWGRSTSPYHRGEQLIQERAEAREFAERIGRQVIREFMTQQHRDFYAMLPFIFVGTLDARKRPWASVLAGAPGFVTPLDPRRLRVQTCLANGDPIAVNLREGVPVAMVGVQFETRRRNRVNGRIANLRPESFELEVGQSFGNCPQYIQARETHAVTANAPGQAGRGSAVAETSLLSQRAVALIEASDTFFIASASPEAGTSDDPVQGADVNHRGGLPGFVRVHEESGRSVITWPDFVGNSAFNTLGNILLNPVAGLLFIDFARGDILSLTGTAETLWDDQEEGRPRGAERLVRFRVDEGVYIADALPLRWDAPEYASQLAGTGTWAEVERERDASRTDNSYRPFVVTRIQDESASVRSFFLAPEGEAPLALHRPGQFLPISVSLGDGSEHRRSYTITSQPGDDLIRLSIKREARPSGGTPSVSHWLHDHATIGSRVHAAQPGGDFVPDPASKRAVVLISAGVGITPMIAMLDDLVAAHAERSRFPDRPIYFLHFVENGRDVAFGEHLRRLASQRPNITLHVRFREPLGTDELGWNYDSTGQIDRALLQRLLPLDDYDVFLCGPPGFMQAAYGNLLGLGIRDERIASESFGPAGLQRKANPAETAPVLLHPVSQAVVEFKQSGHKVRWSPSSGSILDAAEAAGLTLPWSCRSGSCGTCRTDVMSGAVTYAGTPAAKLEAGTALLCRALPATAALVLDA